MLSTNASSESEVVFSIPEELVPSRNDQVQPTISLDFDGSLNPPLFLKQDLKEGCGGKTWPAGMVLAEYFLNCKLDTLHSKAMFVHSRLNAFQSGGRSILDGFSLTCGTLDLSLGQVVALLGIHLAEHYSFHVLSRAKKQLISFRLAISIGLSNPTFSSHDASITVTDIPAMLPLINANIALNPTKISIQSLSLSWGKPLPVAQSFKAPNIILAADCCYYEPAFPLLLDTLDELVGQASDVCCYFCFKKRRKADLGFLKMARKRFDVRDGGLDDPKREVWQREGILL